MSDIPQGWKQGSTPNIYEANIKQVNISTGTVSLVAETNKTNGSYTVYTTSGINFIGTRQPLYTVSSSGATTVNNQTLYNGLQSSGEITTLNNSIKPRAFEINQSFGTTQEKAAVANSPLYKSIANAATSTQTTYSQAGVGQLASDNAIKTQIGTDRIRQALGGNDIVYPTKLRTNKQDFIKFTMVDYGQKEFQLAKAGKNLGLGKRTLLNDSIISVYLPIQPSINDQNDIGWGEDNMNVFKAVLANIATQGSATTLASELDKVGEIFGSGEYATVIRRSLGGAAVGINPIARTDGLVLNPNLELLFSGPSLRPFNFTFRLSPRSQTEADEVKRVIKFFKLGSTVRTTSDSIFLRAPYVFNIAYKYNGPDDKNDGHPGLNKIKTCALRSVTVNYTPDGSYMTFEDGTMTSYEISLQFCELEPVYDRDYLENNNLNHPIGF
jgi:hypothetical protein